MFYSKYESWAMAGFDVNCSCFGLVQKPIYSETRKQTTFRGIEFKIIIFSNLSSHFGELCHGFWASRTWYMMKLQIKRLILNLCRFIIGHVDPDSIILQLKMLRASLATRQRYYIARPSAYWPAQLFYHLWQSILPFIANAFSCFQANSSYNNHAS